jgi:poly [ADP-ribose] polymerase
MSTTATVVEHRKFSCTKLGNNNNKYWNVTLYDNGDVMSEWGRQGKTKQSKTWPGVGRSFMEKKIAEKDKKGYHENKVVEGTGSLKVSAHKVANNELKDIAGKQIKSKNPVVAKLIDFLVKVNAHAILKATGGQIQYDTSTASFKTTQGIVIPSQVSRARDLLVDIYDSVKDGVYSGYDFEDKLNEYLSLIPRDFGMKRMSPRDILPDTAAIQKENDILDGLDSSFAGLQTKTAKKKTTKKKKTAPKLFEVEMDIITDKKILSHVKHLYQSTRKSMHQSNNLSVQTVYAIKIANMKKAFENYGASLPNVWQLWHGTKASNLLSIMKGGLIIPSSSSGHVTGRMYGDGIYFSDISTKALNYATNYWGGGGSTDRTFMFLADVAMGKYHIAKSSWSGYPKKGSDSTWAKGRDKGGVNSGVINDEMIVYRLDQCNLVYLVEFVPRNQYRG